MNITLIAVGRAKQGPEKELVERYTARLNWAFALREVEEKRPLKGETLKLREAELLKAATPTGAIRVALDERGKGLNSRAFADRLGRWRDQGVRDIAFWIGGADGLQADLRNSADLVLSLGTLTWPHMLVRALITEQVYRAEQILLGGPYHRE